MELAELDMIYAFVVSWNDVSRGVFLAEFFPTLETCMTFLNQWSYDPEQVNLSCKQIFPD